MDDQYKIYVVVAVLSIILIGIAAYMFAVEKKLGKLEAQIKSLAKH